MDPASILLLYPRPSDLRLFLRLVICLDLLKGHRLRLEYFGLLSNLVLILLNRDGQMVHLNATFVRNRHWVGVCMRLLLAAVARVSIVPLLPAAADRLVVRAAHRLLVFGRSKIRIVERRSAVVDHKIF